MTVEMNYTQTLVVEYCYQCGIPFGMPTDFKSVCLRDRKTFYCPNGHGQHYIGKTDAERLREERERSARLRAELDQTAASNRSLRGVITKKKKVLERVKNGVCPCCNRHFENLERHISTKHPEYTP